MISRLFSSMMIVLILTGCSKEETTAPTQPQSSDDLTNTEYTVLVTLVGSFYFDQIDSLIIEDSTSPGINSDDLENALTSELQYVSEHAPDILTETMEDFKSKNLTHTYIRKPTSIHPACVYSSTAHLTYPRIVVSRVGFNSGGMQALAYVENVNGPRSGTGCFYILSQEDGMWVVLHTVIVKMF